MTAREKPAEAGRVSVPSQSFDVTHTVVARPVTRTGGEFPARDRPDNPAVTTIVPASASAGPVRCPACGEETLKHASGFPCAAPEVTLDLLDETVALHEQIAALREEVERLKHLHDLDHKLADEWEQKIHAVDEALARRTALDGLDDRVVKIWKACKRAGEADKAEARVAELEKERDEKREVRKITTETLTVIACRAQARVASLLQIIKDAPCDCPDRDGIPTQASHYRNCWKSSALEGKP